MFNLVVNFFKICLKENVLHLLTHKSSKNKYKKSKHYDISAVTQKSPKDWKETDFFLHTSFLRANCHPEPPVKFADFTRYLSTAIDKRLISFRHKKKEKKKLYRC